MVQKTYSGTMTFLVISHAPHFQKDEKLFSYGPLVKEMVLWEKYTDQMWVFAPEVLPHEDSINLPYQSGNTRLISTPLLDFTSGPKRLKSLLWLPWIIFSLYYYMWKADHIHLRCPGNLALIGCFLQIVFPWKKKTVKYAGNWDPASPQPLTYKIQRWVINNTWLSRNMTVMVYGNWPHSSKNIKPFFTASYLEKEFVPFQKPESGQGINLVFVGSLVPAKNPLTAIQVLEQLVQNDQVANLVYCGEGSERPKIESFAINRGLHEMVCLAGNVNSEKVKQILIQSHFLIFLSESEGWPKVVAEAMTWGCIPLTSSVSCVPEMLGYGARGILIDNDPVRIAQEILKLVQDPGRLANMQFQAQQWAKQFTLEKFGESLCELV